MTKITRCILMLFFCCIGTTWGVYAQGNDATLNSLTVNEGALSPVFSKTTTNYTVAVENHINVINITATATDENATISGNTGFQTLIVGENSFTITVTAENGTDKQDYTLKITRAKSSDATLASLLVSAGALSPTFNANTTSYAVDVESHINTINVAAEANHANAIVSGHTGNQPLSLGANNFTVTVTAEDESTKNYAIVVTRAPHTITALVNNNYGGTIDPMGGIAVAEGSDTTFYFTAEMNYELYNVLIDGTSNEDAIENGTYTFTEIDSCHTIEVFFVSTDATLSSLSVNKGMLTPSFSPDILEYTVELGKDVPNITIEALANHTAATVEGNIEYILSTGENDITIICVAENRNEQVYKIAITRAPYIITSSVNANYGGIIDPEGAIEVDAGSTHTYTITPSTGYAIKDILINNIANSDAIANGTYTFNDIDADYTIEAFFASTEARLSNLTVSSGTLSPLFDAEIYNYTVNVSNDISSITLTGVAINSRANVSNVAEQPLDKGNNTFDIVVIAEDGVTTKTYTVTVIRPQSSDATLRGLTVNNGFLTPAFNANITNYVVNVTNNVAQITITGTANQGATVDGNVTNAPLMTGENQFDITVTAENGIIQNTYTVIVVRGLSSDADLSSLIVSQGALTPVFSSNTTSYTVNVATDVSTITLTGTANHEEALVAGNVTDQTLNIGDNIFNIIVTAENGTSKTYTITVIRGQSSDATLKSLTVNNGELTPAFNPNTINYTVNVANTVSAITLTGIANNATATITGNVTNSPLIIGDNVFKIDVIAQDAVTKKTYTITVVRAKSSDATLKSLAVSNGFLAPAFNANTTSYTVNVAHDIATISLNGTTNHTEATVTGNIVDGTLAIGNNSFDIKVTAEDGATTRIYNVIVVRAKSPDATLRNLTVSEGTLTPAFNANTANYTVNVSRDIETIGITGIANHAQASIIGNVTDATLELGNNTFRIEVTAENGTTKRIYTVTVIRDKSSDATLENLTASNGALTPEFDANITNYTIEVNNDINTINLTGTASHTGAIVVGNITDGLLNTGENTFEITVTAEDGISTKNYTITVIRAKSTDATLQNMTINRGVLVPVFNSNITDYSVEVGDNTTTFTVNVIANHEQAVIKGNVTGATLELGKNTFEVIVTAEDGATTKTYTIVVARNKSTGVDNVENNNTLALYPNPAKDILYIESSEPVQRISIYNITGKMVKQIEKTGSSLDISDLTKGLYLIRIATPQGETIRKIIKE